MKQMDGFKGYYLVLTPDGTVMAVSLFTNKTVAETSTQKLLPWGQGKPRPAAGLTDGGSGREVVISEVVG